MPHAILNENWAEYDNRKLRDGRDRSKFSCDESWEVDYLINKLRKHYTYKTDSALRAAISDCCKLPGNRTREVFIECITKRLDS
jgi:hypothetical protein